VIAMLAPTEELTVYYGHEAPEWAGFDTLAEDIARRDADEPIAAFAVDLAAGTSRNVLADLRRAVAGWEDAIALGEADQRHRNSYRAA
jgi:hypothetical protein